MSTQRDRAGAIRAMASGITAKAGHLALWLGLYFCAVYACAAALLGRTLSWLALAGCFFAGVGLYLLDRVKARDAWLDRADAQAQPERYAFLLARRRRVRALAWVSLAAGAAAVAAISPLNLLLAPVGILGVLVYGSVHRPGRRPKDVLLIKNLLPGGAIAGLGVFLAWQSPPLASPPALPHAAGTLLALLLIVTADAMLCDLDDTEIDRAHRTQTVPARFGRRATWLGALAMHAAAVGAILGVGAAAGTMRTAAALAGADLALTGALWAIEPPTLRDWVDMRLALVAAAAWLFG